MTRLSEVEVWLRQKLRTFDQTLLQALLRSTVAALQEEIPGLGEIVAFDVKHIYAWVKENNPRVYMKGRYDKTHQLGRVIQTANWGSKRGLALEQADGTWHAKK